MKDILHKWAEFIFLVTKNRTGAISKSTKYSLT